ncbi:tetratricopeptide repeat protein [Geomesophilobacter sediminis]|uniref:Tetratricopeptide repeat protein n=1 Tax=Geomesophilobacter sediminis TaxID=2798584 RepID=A0A8J7S831_9BACT|nr:tetratricopeptide repeat protein [Geomesophilobacter sediminis]MBJ6727406.1 tetratricopeptide repeat protein [Geomesophilobacter sediminis]
MKCRYPFAFPRSASRKGHTRSGARLAALLFLLALSAGAPAGAAETPAYRPDLAYYLHKYLGPKEEKLVLDEVKRYRSYPRLDRAYRMQRAGRLAEARSEFEAYLTLVPEDIRSRLSYVALLERMGLYREEIAQSDVVLKRFPNFVPAALYKAQALGRLGDPVQALALLEKVAATPGIRSEDRIFALSAGADLAVSGKDHAAAARLFVALAEAQPTYRRWLDAGSFLQKAGRLPDALNAYAAAEQHASTAPERLAAALEQAEVARKLNLPDRARHALETVAANDPGNRAALRALADAAYHAGNLREAEKWLAQLVRHGKATPQDRLFLANLYVKRNDYAAAIPQLKAAIAQQGNRAGAETLAELAQVLESAGNLKESAHAYRQLVARHPNHGDAQFRFGVLLVRLEQWAQAVPVLERALALELTDKERRDAHANLALALEKSGRYRDAAAELEKGLPEGGDPHRAELLIRQARLLTLAGTTDEALSRLERALATPGISAELTLQAHREKSAALEKAGQSAAAAAELEKALSSGPADPAEMIRLARLLEAGGNHAESLRRLDQVLALAALAPSLRRDALRQKGVILERERHPLEAAQQFEQLVQSGDDTAATLLTLANLYDAAGRPEAAIPRFQQVLARKAAAAADRCSAAEALAQDRLKLNQTDEAETALAASLRLCGENRQRHYYLGLVRYKQRRWDEALEQFTLADPEAKEPATLLQMALCQKELDRPGVAIHYLQIARRQPDKSKELTRRIEATLGYLYAEEHAYDNAAQAFSLALAGGPDPVLNLKLAGMLQRAGKETESGAVLDQVDPKQLSPEDRLEYQDLKAAQLEKQGHLPEALALLEENRKQQPTAARSHALGVLYLKAGERAKAIDRFRAAREKEPERDEYLLALGYAYLAEDRFTDAIPLFKKVAARNPDNVKLREELGYANEHAGRNEEADRWFAEALERLPELAADGSEESLAREQDAYRLRSELAKLRRTFTATAYASYRAGKAQTTLVTNNSTTVAGLNGQLGVEAAYRPPKIGLIDDRILEVFGRVFGDLHPDRLTYNGTSTQAGLGVRYKLLKEENLWISGERLFRIGRNGMADWLGRLLYSRGAGFEPTPWEKSTDYYLIYGELDGYLTAHTVATYTELRKGRAFTLRPDTLLSPYLVLDARWQSPYGVGGDYAEGGAGLSLRYFFNETRGETYRSSVDLSVSYKHGYFYGRGTGNDRGGYDTAVVGVGVNF